MDRAGDAAPTNRALSANLLELIAAFSRLVEAKSSTAVARVMGSAQPTVSLQLEAHPGVRLFHRTTRSLTRAEEGRAYYEHAALVLDAVEGAEAAIRPGREHVRGRLRIAGPLAFTRLRLVPRLKRFLAAYADLDVELVAGDRTIDLVGEGVDGAIHIGEMADQRLMVRRVGETRRVAVASPGYLRGRARPEHPDAPSGCDCSVFTAMRDPHERSSPIPPPRTAAASRSARGSTPSRPCGRRCRRGRAWPSCRPDSSRAAS